jgi:hypothetical protein
VRPATALVVVLLAAGVVVSLAGAAAPAGIRGTLVRSPTTPVCREGQPCSAPASGYALLVTRRGRTIARTTTAKDGTFRVVLAPGRYVVQLGRAPAIGGLPPRAVRVVRGRFTAVRLVIDTGIR